MACLTLVLSGDTVRVLGGGRRPAGACLDGAEGFTGHQRCTNPTRVETESRSYSQ